MSLDQPATFWRSCGFPTKDFAVCFLAHNEEFSDEVDEILGVVKKSEKIAMREIKKLIDSKYTYAIDQYHSIYSQNKAKRQLQKELSKNIGSLSLDNPPSNTNCTSNINWDTIKSILIKYGINDDNIIPCIIELQQHLKL